MRRAWREQTISLLWGNVSASGKGSGGQVSRHYGWKLGEPLPVLGEHSVAKHDIFEQYVGIYIERLTRTPSQTMLNLTIVDGFSGGGLYRLGSKEVDGSPLRLLTAVEAADAALKAARSKGFAVRADFFFIDENPQHVAFLKEPELWIRGEGISKRSRV
ncbi:hypothetical protein CCS01_05650 [Rhodopila globiformis]|uniref:Uncharacterized protein n=1 Tax=Rhodopila globiformis TaxID=1071 RepID=A0A2S6NLD5_RHOGL|nr:hypothetical protein CCS01_05650 [Rhodopila globiformis]